MYTLIPYVLYILREVKNNDDRNKIFDYLERYIIRRNLAGLSTKSYNALFTENLIGSGIATPKALSDHINQRLSNTDLHMPSDQEVRDECKKPMKVNKRARTILYLMETKLMLPQSSTALIPFNEFSLEHLMPQKWKKNWPLTPNKTEDERNGVIYNFGNLAIIHHKLNTAVSNADWATKLEGKSGNPGLKVCASGLQTMKTPLNCSSWDEQKIADRTNELTDFAITIWPA